MLSLQWYRSPGKEGSHFNPYSDMFPISERKAVLTSTVCWSIMVALLLVLSFVAGPVQVLKLYGVPYWVCKIYPFHVDELLELVDLIYCPLDSTSICRFSSCGWTLSLICSTMAMSKNFPGTVARY